VLSGLKAQVIKDIDGNVYHTVTIGTQVWMVENLKVTHYRNGDPIPNVIDSMAWRNLTSGAYCDYDNNSDNSIIFGKLYNWHAVQDIRNIAPIGWHVPTDAEWMTLTTCLGGDSIAGGKLKEIGTIHWPSPNLRATNESGFTALPCKYRKGDTGTFGYDSNYLWTSTQGDYPGTAWYRCVSHNNYCVCRYIHDMKAGFAVRCVKD